MPKPWFSITNAADAATAEISIFDAIGATWDGEGVTAKGFIDQLRAIQAPQILLTVNSPGGSLFDGVAISNALRAHPSAINGKVMGVAASAATVVLMGCDSIEMPANAYMMIHKASSWQVGNADAMRETADMLDLVDSSIVGSYANRTGKTRDEIKALLDGGDVWLTADQALEMGLIDTVLPEQQVSAKFDPAALPAKVQSALKTPAPLVPPGPTKPAPAAATPMAEQIRALAAEAKLGDLAAVFALDPALTTIEAARAAINEAREVVAYAALVGKTDLGTQLVKKRTPLAEALPLVQAAWAADDPAGVDNTAPGNEPPAPATPPTTGPLAFWASRK